MTEHEPQHGWTQVDGVRLHYWEWPGAEPTILCMHGLTANGRFWDTLAERLEGRHRLVAIDFRGRGLSDKPPGGSYGWDRHARDMLEVMHALGTGTVIAVGHSMGGYVATLLAAESEHVSRLVVVDAGLELREADVRLQIAASLQRITQVFPSLEAYFTYWRQLPFIQWTPAFERYLVADVEERADGTVVCRTLPVSVEEDLLYYFRPGEAERFAHAAREVRAPTLVCWAPVGLVDPARPLMSRPGIDELAGLIPGAQVLPMDGTNHYTILLAPDIVDRIIEAIDGLPAAPGEYVRSTASSSPRLTG